MAIEASRNKIGHAYSKINAENPTDSLETQSIKFLYKNSVFKSSRVDCGTIQKSYLLSYESGGGGLCPHKKKVAGPEGPLALPPPPLPLPIKEKQL